MDLAFVMFVGSREICSWRVANPEGVGESDSFRYVDLRSGVFDLIGSFDYRGFLPF